MGVGGARVEGQRTDVADPAARAEESASWQVVLLRPPPAARGRHRPFIVSSGGWDVSHRVLEGVRRLGWGAALLQADPEALCGWHPPQFRDAACQGCGRAVCATCRGQARGANRCPPCAAVALARRRNTRLRKLFAAFLFTVFAVEVSRWASSERDAVDASGPVRVAFVQLVQPDAVGASLVDEMDAHGIAELSAWFASERARYDGGAGPFVEAYVLGPWVANVQPPLLPARRPTFLDQLRVALAFPTYFHDLARARGVDPDAYGARVYVVYGREGGDLAGDSRGSRKGRIAVSFVNVDDTLAYAQVTLAHELGHIFGASDQYDSGSHRARYPEGYVQPWAEPPYPQTYAELMAVDVPLGPRTEREIASLDEVRVGYRTAAAFGWIAEDTAAAYYARGVFAAEERLRAPAEGGEDTGLPALDDGLGPVFGGRGEP